MQDVTFIIQGGIQQTDVSDVLERSQIGKYFPESKIIVSIWGSSVGVKQISKNVMQVSNGPAKHYKVKGERWALNFENQCISTLGGLKICQTKYAVKFRSDCYFTGDNLRKIFDDFISSKKKLLLNSKSISLPYPFYGIDYFQIGVTEQLTRIWEKSLEINIDLTRYKKFDTHYFDRRENFLSNLHPEQVLYFAQFGGPIKERDYRPSVREFMKARGKIERENFCIGRRNLQIEGVKHSNSVFDFCPHFFSLSPLSQLRGLISLCVGIWTWR